MEDTLKVMCQYSVYNSVNMYAHNNEYERVNDF